MKYYLQALSNYTNFSGRARRKEYWLYLLFNSLFGLLAIFLDVVLGLASELGYGPIYLIYVIAMFIPGLAVTVRRLHDVGKSGWMYFIVLIPIIGAIWLLVLLVSEGDQIRNRYGESPKSSFSNTLAT